MICFVCNMALFLRLLSKSPKPCLYPVPVQNIYNFRCLVKAWLLSVHTTSDFPPHGPFWSLTRREKEKRRKKRKKRSEEKAPPNPRKTRKFRSPHGEHFSLPVWTCAKVQVTISGKIDHEPVATTIRSRPVQRHRNSRAVAACP